MRPEENVGGKHLDYQTSVHPLWCQFEEPLDVFGQLFIVYPTSKLEMEKKISFWGEC